MKKCGFTLIELLAVIIVLAIIALIATPIIFNVIENAKLKSLENSSYGVIDAIRVQYAENLLNSTDGNVLLSGKVKDIKVAGEQPKEGSWMVINSPDATTGRGIKITNVTFDSMKGYYCSNDISTGKVTCSKEKQEEIYILKDVILSEPLKGENQVWTTAWQDDDESGLYQETVGSNKTYYFRGQPTNNYLKFADILFRIVRINEDGTIRIITQDSVMSSQVFNSIYDTYDKMYYTNSELKTVVDDWYTTNITGDNASKVVSGNYFCEQAKVIYNTDFTVGNASVAVSDAYTPSFNCTTDGNGKGIVSGKVGLITIDEVLYAGGVIGNNSNFYLKNGSVFRTMSPAGFTNNYYNASTWFVDRYGITNTINVCLISDVRPVINLNANTIVTGSGTETNPYIVK